MRVCLLSSGICCLSAFALIKVGIPRVYAVLLLLPGLLGVVSAIWFAIDILVKRPIEKVSLGDCLQIWPSRAKYSIDEVTQLELVASPEQEYAAMLRDAQLTVRSGWQFQAIRLTLDAADATSLTTWAKEHGIPVVGTELVR
jgi:hypothetical protein